MANKPRRAPLCPVSDERQAELQQILDQLKSPDEQARAEAVRSLCPCRGTEWGTPVFPVVWELRNDPSAIVQKAVKHDLRENPEWGERAELRRLEGRHQRREARLARAEADAEPDEQPAPHSLAWRMPRRPRRRKAYYPRGRR